MLRRYALGIDPGYRCLGFCFMDMDTLVGAMKVIDLATWADGKKRKLRDRDLIPLTCDMVVDKFDEWLQQTEYVFIERQPGMGSPRARQMGTILETLFTARYQNLEVFGASSVSIKYFFGVQEDDYPDRKKQCMAVGIVDPDEIGNIERAFDIRTNASQKSKFRVDGFEAAMICLYGKDNIEKERKLKCPRSPGFGLVSYAAQFHQTTITDKQRRINKKLRLEKRAAKKAAEALKKKAARAKKSKLAPKPRKVPIARNR